MKRVLIDVPHIGLMGLASAKQTLSTWQDHVEELWDLGRYSDHNRMVLMVRALHRNIKAAERELSKVAAEKSGKTPRLIDPTLIVWEATPFLFLD